MTDSLPPLGKSSRLGRFKWFGAFIVIVAIAVGAAFLGMSLKGGGGSSGGDNAGNNGTPQAGSTGTPADTVSAEQALSDYIKTTLNQDYAGDCSTAIVPAGSGMCSAARGDRGDQKAFLIGPSSYQFTTWVFLKKTGTAWTVESTLPVNPDTVNAPGAPWPLEKGATVVVGGTGTCLNVRVSPSIKADAVDCIADGTTIVLQDGPVTADGYDWWRPQDRSGWVVGDYLRYPDTTTPTPGGAVTPAPTATSTPTG